MDGAQRRFAMVDRRLDRADRGEDRLGPGRVLGERHERAIVQLQRRRMGELARIEEERASATGRDRGGHRSSMANIGRPENKFDAVVAVAGRWSRKGRYVARVDRPCGIDRDPDILSVQPPSRADRRRSSTSSQRGRRPYRRQTRSPARGAAFVPDHSGIGKNVPRDKEERTTDEMTKWWAPIAPMKAARRTRSCCRDGPTTNISMNGDRRRNSRQGAVRSSRRPRALAGGSRSPQLAASHATRTRRLAGLQILADHDRGLVHGSPRQGALPFRVPKVVIAAPAPEQAPMASAA